MLFKSKTSQGDYHGDMNSINFEKWLHQQLLPNLKKPSLIILDNAAYHSRQLDKWPTKTWKKSDIQQWLRSKNISFPEHSTLGVLWDVINKIPKNDKIYAVNKIIEDAGHEVLRLPPYHCQFNAIELVWSQTKRYYDQHILKIKNPEECWKAALEQVTVEQWANYVGHCTKLIKDTWEKEKLIVSVQKPIIINLDDDSDVSNDE